MTPVVHQLPEEELARLQRLQAFLLVHVNRGEDGFLTVAVQERRRDGSLLGRFMRHYGSARVPLPQSGGPDLLRSIAAGLLQLADRHS
jgi:hypothetical protein